VAKRKSRSEKKPRTLEELVTESKRLRESADSIQEKMLKLVGELEANRKALEKSKQRCEDNR
jgi:hypothetical protein